MKNSKLLASGFRPTFLAVGIAAVLLLPTWVLIWGFGLSLPSRWPPTLWHAHEMVFGFVGMGIAGFLLTAVPNWTGQRGFSGAPLASLVVLWLLGRALIATSAAWPEVLVAVVDVGFLVLLGVLVAPPLLRSTNRNTPLLVVLALFAACNAATHWALAHADPGLGQHAILIAIDIALLLVTIIGGRIIPTFTANALRAANSPVRLLTWTGVGPATITVMVLVTLCDVFWSDTMLAGVLAAAAAVLQAIRLAQWRGLATLRSPILWVLHLGYAWLPLGFALKATALLWGPAASAFWLHALTVGVLATMLLAVMTRASLGHTGRPLVVEPVIVLAYGLLLAAPVVRVFGLSLLGLAYPTVILVSATCWTLAFGIFLFVYAPILYSARQDAEPG
jgi:uncharacterized protein involved in response to NO